MGRKTKKKLPLQLIGLGVLAIATLGVVGYALTETANPPTTAGPAVTASPIASAGPTSSSVPPFTIKRTPGEPLRVFITGDSLTGGLSASKQNLGFKWLVFDRLEKSGPVEEFNTHLSGGKTVEVAARFKEMPTDLDLAIIELGTNDLNDREPMADFRAAYDSLLDRVRAANPETPLLCAGVWQGGGGGPDDFPYDSSIQDICVEHGGQFVSLTELYRDPSTIGPAGLPAFEGLTDTFHPNDKGHRVIADALLARVDVI